MRVTIVALLCLLMASSSFANWSTNAWPSYLYPLQGVTQFQDSHSGAVERCNAVGVETPDVATNLYLSHRNNLIEIKDKLSLCITNFVNTNEIASGNYQSWFDKQLVLTEFPDKDSVWLTNSTLTVKNYGLPAWTVTGLCAHIKIPTNFFNNTPYTSLSGCGGSTNDPTVGHPHGFTNSYTATNSAGDFFPGARGEWYTTDYGYANIQDICNELHHSWVYNKPVKGSTLSYPTVGNFTNATNAYISMGVEWASNLTASVQAPGNTRIWYTEFAVTLGTPDRYAYDQAKHIQYPKLDNVWTGITHSVDLYRCYTVGSIIFTITNATQSGFPQKYDNTIDNRFQWFDGLVPSGAKNDQFVLEEAWGSATNKLYVGAVRDSASWSNNPSTTGPWSSQPPNSDATNFSAISPGRAFDYHSYNINVGIMGGVVDYSSGSSSSDPYGRMPGWEFPDPMYGGKQRDIWIIKWDGFDY